MIRFNIPDRGATLSVTLDRVIHHPGHHFCGLLPKHTWILFGPGSTLDVHNCQDIRNQFPIKRSKKAVDARSHSVLAEIDRFQWCTAVQMSETISMLTRLELGWP